LEVESKFLLYLDLDFMLFMALSVDSTTPEHMPLSRNKSKLQLNLIK